MNIHLLAIFLVSLGSFLMIGAILGNTYTQNIVPPQFRKYFELITLFLFFFLCGYLYYVYAEIYEISFPLRGLIGVVFFCGSLFVFLVIMLNRLTINAINKTTEQLQESHDRLEERVKIRTAELDAANLALQTENQQRQKAQVALEESHAELDQIFNTAADAMRVVNTDFEMIKVNDTFALMLGMDKDKLVGRKCYEVLHGPVCHTPDCPLERIQESAQLRIEEEAEKTTVGGKDIPCIVTATPFSDLNGQLLGIIEDFKDITALKAAEEKLRHLSVTDEMTGAFNRRGFIKLGARQLKTADRLEGQLYLLFADLDGLKPINDTHGHDAGDQAIREAATILLDTYRDTDVVGRLGGDEFAVLLIVFPADCDVKECVTDRLEKNIAAANSNRAQPYDLSISIGVVKYQPDIHPDIETLIADGDKLMYEQKKGKKAAAGSVPR